MTKRVVYNPKAVSCGQTLFLSSGWVCEICHRAVCRPHYGICTSHSAVFSHMLLEECD